MRRLFNSILILVLLAMNGLADEIDFEVRNGLMLKMLRDMASKTNASDSLNLPANASSIRENITDTFSCENRTYGYYADVDNECQIFHVCLPSQTPSGRNITYRWSFICPNETIFNQEVLVCTRPIDSIPCEESPNYYDLNMEIGKTPPKNETSTSTKIRNDEIYNTNRIEATERDRNQNQYSNGRDRNRNQIQKRKPDNRKQNIIIDNLFKEIVDEEMKEKLENIGIGDHVEEIFPDLITDELPEEFRPQSADADDKAEITDDIEGRLALERNVGDVNSKRRSFRFRADV